MFNLFKLNEDDFIKSLIDENNIKLLKFLLNIRIIDKRICNKMVVISSERGAIKALKLLLSYKYIDPAFYKNSAIRLAAFNGHYKAVKLLLNDKRIDPTINDSETLRNAAFNGFASIVELLLLDKRIDINALNGYAIKYAIINSHYNVLKILYNNKKIDRKYLDVIYINSLSENSNIKFVKKVLKDKNLKINKKNMSGNTLKRSVINNHVELTELLLSLNQANGNLSYLLCVAINNGNVEIVKSLLKKGANPDSLDLSFIPFSNDEINDCIFDYKKINDYLRIYFPEKYMKIKKYRLKSNIKGF